MRIGISLQPVTLQDEPGRVVRVARETERLGFDAVYMSGHVLSEGGEVPDPMAVLAVVAGATERVALATSVLLLPQYNPVLLANEAATLDVLSGGRFVLGVGVGWNPAEFDAVGVPFRERGARADEYLTAMRALWAGRPATFEGRYVAFRDARLGMTPTTPGGPPVWVGGHSDAALRRALRFANAWHGTGLAPTEVAGVRARIARLADGIGRDPTTLGVNGIWLLVPPVGRHNGFVHGHLLGGGSRPSADAVLEDLRLLAAEGIEDVNVLLPVQGDGIFDAVSWLGEEVLPHVPDAVAAARA